MGGVKVRRCGAFSPPCVLFPLRCRTLPRALPVEEEGLGQHVAGGQSATCKGKYEKIKRGPTVILLHFGSVAA